MTQVKGYIREKQIEALISEHRIPHIDCAEASVHLAKEALGLFAMREDFLTKYYKTEKECIGIIAWTPYGAFIIYRAKKPIFSLLLKMILTVMEELATDVRIPISLVNEALGVELFKELEEKKTTLIACDTEEELHDILDDDIETESIEEDSEWI